MQNFPLLLCLVHPLGNDEADDNDNDTADDIIRDKVKQEVGVHPDLGILWSGVTLVAVIQTICFLK